MVQPTGTVTDTDRGPALILERRFDALIETVWAHVARSERLETWIGRWETDQKTGRVLFFMTAESADAEGQECMVRLCQPPSRLVVDVRTPGGTWHLAVAIESTLDGTLLTFSHRVGAEGLESIGPGWEYYLDRLGAVLAGGSADDVSWDDYHPALASHYAALVPEGSVSVPPARDGLEP